MAPLCAHTEFECDCDCRCDGYSGDPSHECGWPDCDCSCKPECKGCSMVKEAATVYPHSGQCARCLRDRDDLFWHREDDKFYCADVLRCEARYAITTSRGGR